MSAASGFASNSLAGLHIYRLPTLAKFGYVTEQARSKLRESARLLSPYRLAVPKGSQWASLAP